MAAATVIPFDHSAAYAFAALRRDRTIQPPDAIQLACASVAGADLFITNDHRLNRKVVPGVHFIQSLATAAEAKAERSGPCFPCHGQPTDTSGRR